MPPETLEVPAAPAAPPAPAKPPEPETFSREYVSELRAENKSWRLKHSDAEKKAAEIEAAAKKVEEESAAKIAAAEKAAQDRIIRAELKAAALKAGMIDLDGLKLADLSTIKLTDSGEIDGADALMESLKKSKPYLFGATTTTSTSRQAPSSKDKDGKFSDLNPEEQRKILREKYRLNV